MSHFEQEVAELKETLLRMAATAKSVISKAVKSLVERDDDLAREVEEEDDAIDQLEIDVDEKAVLLLSKAPLAKDLRLIIVALKTSHDLERVGDESVTIARRSIELGKEPQLKDYIDIPRMTAMAIDMLDDALDAFVTADADKAKGIVPRDKEIDALNKQMQRELAGYMVEDPKNISRCLHLMTISKSLERIADHAKNIAEEVVFLYEGRDIRHAANLGGDHQI
jgi:phosphate transport system protein